MGFADRPGILALIRWLGPLYVFLGHIFRFVLDALFAVQRRPWNGCSSSWSASFTWTRQSPWRKPMVQPG
jgi:hypothetical protein